MSQSVPQPNRILLASIAELPSVPGAEERVAFTALSAQALVVENLVALLSREGSQSTLPIQEYLEIINKLKLIPGEKARIDFKVTCLTIGVAQQEASAIAASKLIVHAMISLHAAQTSPISLKSAELQVLHTQRLQSARELVSKLTGKDGTPFGLAKDLRREQFEEMLLEVLAPDEADLEARRKIKEEYASLPQLPESAVKVDPEFSFLAVLLNSQRSRLSDQDFTKNLWHAFGPRLSKIFEIPDREERADRLKAGLRSICNLVAKEYLVSRKNLSRATLVAQASETQSKHIADLVVESLQGYLFAGGGEARIHLLQSQFHNAAKQLSTTIDLIALLHSSDTFLLQLRQGIGNLDLSETAKTQWRSRGNSGFLGSSLTQATLLIAATPKGENIHIPSSSGQLLIGHTAAKEISQTASGGTGEQTLPKEKYLLKPNPYFVPENGYPSRFQLLSVLQNQIKSLNDIDAFSRSLAPLLRTAFDQAILSQQRADLKQPALVDWISNLHALYEGSASDSNKRTQTLIGAWEYKTRKVPELNNISIKNLNETFAASQGPSAPEISRAELTAAYFLTSVLAAYIRGADDRKESTRIIFEAVEKLHEKSGEITYLMIRTQLALLLESPVSEPANSALPPSEPAIQPAARGGFSFLRKKVDVSQSEPLEAQKIHQGDSFQDLRARVTERGAHLLEKLESLKFLDQQSELRVIVAGKDDISAFQATLRNTSNKTHPDTRSQDFPQTALHAPLDAIYKAIMELKKLVGEDSEYDGVQAKAALAQLVKGVADLARKEIDLENQVQNKILAQLELLTDEVIGLRKDISVFLTNGTQSDSKDSSQAGSDQ